MLNDLLLEPQCHLKTSYQNCRGVTIIVFDFLVFLSFFFFFSFFAAYVVSTNVDIILAIFHHKVLCSSSRIEFSLECKSLVKELGGFFCFFFLKT